MGLIMKLSPERSQSLRNFVGKSSVKIGAAITALAIGGGTYLAKQHKTTEPTSVMEESVTPASAAHYVALTWGPPSSMLNLRYYYLYRNCVNGNLKVFPPFGIHQFSYNDTSVYNGKTCTYWLRSEDIHGIKSSNSNEVTVTIPPR
jgi:hypothetical protein